MADNVTLNSGSGGATLATDDIGGVQFQRVKATWGADGTATDVAAGASALPISDGGNTITVDGTVATTNGGTFAVQVDNTVTVGSHAVTNAGTFAVQVSSVVPGTAATNLGKAEDAAHSSGDVGVMALAVRQDTAAALGGTDADYQPLISDGSGRLHVNVGNTVTVGSHAVTNAGTFAVQVDGAAITSLQLIDDVVKTDDAAFTPATDKVLMIGAEADEGSPDSVDEGDAGALRMTLTRALHVNLRDAAGAEVAVGGGTQYTEDAAAAANPVGTALILVREDSLGGSLTTTDGDNVAARGNNKGEQYVKHTDAIAVSSITTAIVPGTGATNLGKAEDAVHSSGDVGVMALSVRKDSAAALAGADADYQPFITDSAGALYVNITNAPISVSGTVSAAVEGSTAHDAAAAAIAPILAGGFASAAAPTDVSADNDAVRAWHLRNGAQAIQPTFAGILGVAGNGASGTGVQRVTVANDSTGILAGVTTVTTVTTVSTLTGGGVAHDGADSGNPHKMGMKAKSSLTGITLVAADDRSDVFCDLDGVPIVKLGAPSGNTVSERVSNTDGASTAFSTFGAAANLRNFITSVTIHNAHASTNGYVDFRDGTAGSIIWTFPAPATGGVTHNFSPPLRQPTANTALAFDVSAAITTVYISINGFQSKA